MVTALKKGVQSLRQIHDAGSVNAALALLLQHLARAAGIFDPHAAMAALGKKLVDVVRDKRDARANRFAVVLRQNQTSSVQPFLSTSPPKACWRQGGS